MKTSSIGNVRVQTADMSRNVHNLSRNIYTSCGFGEVQPCSMLDCQQPGTQNIKNEFLCYLADVVCPTYGHVNVEFWHYFVKYSDLFEVYPRLMAQTKTFNNHPALGYDKSLVADLPTISRNILSCLLLIGAHCTIYKVTNSLNNNRILQQVGWDSVPASSQNIAAQADWNKFLNDSASYLRDITGDSAINAVASTSAYNSKYGLDSSTPYWTLDIRLLIDNVLINSIPKSMRVVLSNPSVESFTSIELQSGATQLIQDGIDIAPVSIDGADFLFERDFATSAHPNSGKYVFAFRMHSFGYRLYKVFKGLEFQEDFTSTFPESIAPFLAYYKAYWNSFGIELYQNWDTTNAGIICRAFDNNYNDLTSFNNLFLADDNDHVTSPVWNHVLRDSYAVNYLVQFFMDVGNCWVTDSQDYVSAQQRSVGVAPSVNQQFVDNVIPVAGAGGAAVTVPISDGSETATESQFGKNQHAYVNLLNHGQLTAEMLQKLYKITNIKTLAGKRIKELLLAEGYGKWMDSQKCAFIGHDIEPVEFSQVISTADTESVQSGEYIGAFVGSRGGRGQAYAECKPHFYENDEPGLLISMCAVVPDSGYTQRMNTAFDCSKKYDFYQREFDGKGFEATKIKYINGERPVTILNNDGSMPNNDTERTFGFAPRMSKFKAVGNILSGHFAKRSTRQSFLPYNTDRFLNVGEVVQTVQSESTDSSGVTTGQFEFTQVFPFGEFPLAGVHWRYPTRYPWLGHYARIFASVGQSYDSVRSLLKLTSILRAGWELFSNEQDGFSLMITLSVRARNAMLQIADSYETTEDSNEGSTNHSLGGKA